MIDNYDSFVYNLVRYFKELNQDIIIYRNDEITVDKINIINPQGIIISPGPKSPHEAGISLEIIKNFGGKIPILGICLGYQAIVQAYGGEIIEGKQPVHGKVSVIKHDGKGIFANLKPRIKVTRYHSLIANPLSIPECLTITSKTIDGVIMGVRHKEYIIEGLQFHPEAVLTEHGHEMLNNFIMQCKGREFC